jgi:D-alanine-D-alanine ligase
MSLSQKKTIAVLFGAPSIEHDISILTGLQVIDAMDATKYDVVPIYIDQQGVWYTGDALFNRRNYPVPKEKLDRVSLHISEVKRGDSRPRFHVFSLNPFAGKKIEFDIAFLTFHGAVGEDGMIQGFFEVAGIPYTGTRVADSAVLRNKYFAKLLYKGLGIPVLPAQIIKRPLDSEHCDIAALAKQITLPFPLCVKPCNLGSSVKVHRADDFISLQKSIESIFKVDTEVLIEPFIENLVEYNVAVSKALGGETRVSVIERPVRGEAILDFKDKYLSNELSSKLSIPAAEGMASAARDFEPADLTESQKELIRESAKKVFNVGAGFGTPRVDFYGNKKTGELWLNEINCCPGSLAYYLWEKAKPSIRFTELIDALIEEGLNAHQRLYKSIDLQEANANIFTREKL